MTRRPQPFKRLLDLAIALPAFILLLPVMLVTAVVAAVGLGRPVLFRQRRPGLLIEPFELSCRILPLPPLKHQLRGCLQLARRGQQKNRYYF